MALKKLDQALSLGLIAIEKLPMNADVHSNLAVIYYELQEWKRAEASFRHALSLQPDHSGAHFSLATLLLHQGSYKQGWKEYQWRFKHHAANPIIRELPNRQAWRGPQEQPQISEIVLLHEQGLGDSLQFIRFAPLLRRFAQRVVLTCPKQLMSLFSSSGLVDQVFEIEADADLFDEEAVWLPLMSVPGILDLPESSFGDTIPYLPVNPSKKNFWQERLDQESNQYISPCVFVALNWQGNPDHEKTTSKGRSIPLECLNLLATIPNVHFISLQKGYGSEQLSTCSFRDRFVGFRDEIDRIWDFEDAAALMSCVSVVVSSDTSAAHLAGAIGARLWMPLKHVSEWRWGVHGSTTPWYPTATLFRQTVDGDWSGPVEAMRLALELEIMQLPSESR